MSATARFGTHVGAKVWLNLDVCGLVCSGITWFIVLFAMSTVSRQIIGPWLSSGPYGALHFILFNGVGVAALVSHLRCMMTNPGAIPPDAVPLANSEERPRTCRRCKSYKNRRTHHCSVCERCILKMDHHCPWVNNCVGLGNHKFFLLFLLYVNLTCGYALTLVVARFYDCLGTYSGCGGTTVSIIMLVVLAILFGLFTLCMMCDQWSVLSTNLTKIDRMQMQGDSSADSSKGKLRAVNEVFGGSAPGFSFWWLVPTAPRYPPSMRREMLGYRIAVEVEATEWTKPEEEEPMLAPSELAEDQV